MNRIKKFSKRDLEKAGIPKDAQVIPTNDCAMQAENTHCAVPYGKMSELLHHSIGDFLAVLDVFAILGIELKILGGNLSDKRQEFMAIVDHMNKRGIKYAITDNAVNRATLLQAIDTYGVNGLVFSLDTLRSIPEYQNLPGTDIGGCSPRKSAAALQLIPEIREEVPYIAVNHMIHAGNMEQTAKIIEYCTDKLEGTIVNLCPMIHGSLTNGSGKNIYIFRSPTETVMPYVIQAKHKERFAALMDEIIELKASDCTVGVPVEYLELLKEHTCGKITWNCGEMKRCPILRLFPNGKFGVCSDLLGQDMQSAGLTPFDLLLVDGHKFTSDERDRRRKGGASYGFIPKLTLEDLAINFARINETWISDRDRKLCCQKGGCVWSNLCIAAIFQEEHQCGTLTATAKNL